MYFNVNMAMDYKKNIENSLLVYLHPQRTGGTRLKKQLYLWYGRDSCYTQQVVKDEFKDWKFIEDFDLQEKLLYAHHSDFWEKEFSKKCYYIATVRHPAYRLNSFYHYCKDKEGHPLQEIANFCTAEQFLIESEKIQPKYIRDFQTLRICRKRDAEKAIKNINKYFLGVSETDRLSEFSGVFSKAINFSAPEIEPVKSDSYKYGSSITSEFFDIACKMNQEDVKLFNWVAFGNQ